jgi:hypothetical protein
MTVTPKTEEKRGSNGAGFTPVAEALEFRNETLSQGVG